MFGGEGCNRFASSGWVPKVSRESARAGGRRPNSSPVQKNRGSVRQPQPRKNTSWRADAKTQSRKVRRRRPGFSPVRSTVQPRGAPIFFVKFPGSVLFSIFCSHGTAHPAVRALSAADGHTGAPAALAPSVTEGTSSSNNHARPPNRLLYLRFPAIN